MASPYIFSNVDFQYANVASQDFTCYVAFLNPVSITTTWSDLNMDAQGNWQPPPNYDTLAHHAQPFAPTANLGGNRIGFVGEPLYFDGSRSCTRHDLPVIPGKHIWVISGGASTTLYDNNQQISATWSSPGIYTVQLTVTDQYGASTTGVRQVMIYQNRLGGLPGVISVSGLSGSITDGGWQCQITTVNSQVTLFPPDSLAVGTYQPVVIMCETRYEMMPGYWVSHTLGPHGSFSPGYPYQDPRIIFDGYVQSGTMHQDVDKDTLSFSCVGPHMILQESKTHQLGYYNANVGSFVHGVPATQKPTPYGQGFMVSSLMTADVVHSILQTHCLIGKYHDLHIWSANIPVVPFLPGSANAYFNLVYTSLSVNEGTIWSNLQDLVGNEWGQIYCERDGSIRVGPQINYRGNEYWNNPILLGQTVASSLINFVQELGYNVGSTMSTMGANIPNVPATPMPVVFVHPWGHQINPPQIAHPFQSTPSPDVVAQQQSTIGPPFLCVFSDVPHYDPGMLPPSGISLFPWVTSGWPQDLAIYPISFDVTENYTGRTSLVKLIGTLATSTNLYDSWYPQNSFSVAGDGTSTIVANVLPAGNWYVEDQKVIADTTDAQNRTLMSHYWWEMARRVYYAQNVNYQMVVTLGMFTGCSLGDIVGITRQNNTLGPHWTRKPFYVQQLEYDLDLTNRTWTTTITAIEVTSALLTPPTVPPKKVPR